ncbi:MAG: transmembrane anchor protein [Alphaproteobacteria bacterium]
MLYQEKPDLKNLPTNAQLLRSSIIAIATAIVLAVAVVLPAEYAIDPTGAGRVLGLTEMGEIKNQLQEEWEADQNHSQAPGFFHSLAQGALGLLVSPAHAQDSGTWMDEVEFTLQPGDTNEVKMTMNEGDIVEYEMIVIGGRVNFDLHGHGGGDSITYERGRGSTGSDGEFAAAFQGGHGWFWRNRDSEAATVTVRVRGVYSELREGE